MGNRPALVWWTYGQGRVVCVLVAALGTSTESHKLFYETATWPRVLSRIIRWAAEPALGTGAE